MVFLLIGLIIAGCVGYWLGSVVVHSLFHR
jgi:hypothetical protein